MWRQLCHSEAHVTPARLHSLETNLIPLALITNSSHKDERVRWCERGWCWMGQNLAPHPRHHQQNWQIGFTSSSMILILYEGDKPILHPECVFLWLIVSLKSSDISWGYGCGFASLFLLFLTERCDSTSDANVRLHTAINRVHPNLS